MENIIIRPFQKRDLKDLEETSEEQIERITELDLAFHRKLCLISGNSLIIKVNQILSNLFSKSMQDVVVALGNQTGRLYHRKIFEAMRRGDQAQTAAILQEHIEKTIDSIKMAKLRQESG